MGGGGVAVSSKGSGVSEMEGGVSAGNRGASDIGGVASGAGVPVSAKVPWVPSGEGVTSSSAGKELTAGVSLSLTSTPSDSQEGAGIGVSSAKPVTVKTSIRHKAMESSLCAVRCESFIDMLLLPGNHDKSMPE